MCGEDSTDTFTDTTETKYQTLSSRPKRMVWCMRSAQGSFSQIPWQAPSQMIPQMGSSMRMKIEDEWISEDNDDGIISENAKQEKIIQHLLPLGNWQSCLSVRFLRNKYKRDFRAVNLSAMPLWTSSDSPTKWTSSSSMLSKFWNLIKFLAKLGELVGASSQTMASFVGFDIFQAALYPLNRWYRKLFQTFFGFYICFYFSYYLMNEWQNALFCCDLYSSKSYIWKTISWIGSHYK